MHSGIGLVTYPINRASITPLSNYVDILIQFSDLYVITGNEAKTLSYPKKEGKNIRMFFINYPIESKICLKIVRYFLGQLKYSYYVLKLAKNAETWIYFTGGERMVLPILTARLLKRHVILYITGSSVKDATFSKDPFLIPVKSMSIFAHILANHIIVYSPNLISEWGLEKYRKKIFTTHRHILDFDIFNLKIEFKNRPPLIGYIGRLSGEKGVQHFAQALPAILSDREDLRVLIGGDGPLKEAIEASLQEGGVSARVDLPGWIPHDDLPPT